MSIYRKIFILELPSVIPARKQTPEYYCASIIST